MMPDIHPGAILADLDLIHSLKQPYWVNSLQPQLHRPRLEVEHLGQHHSVREQVVRGDLDNRDSVKNLPEEHLDHLALDPRQLDLKRSARQHPRRPKPSERQRPHRHHHPARIWIWAIWFRSETSNRSRSRRVWVISFWSWEDINSSFRSFCIWSQTCGRRIRFLYASRIWSFRSTSQTRCYRIRRSRTIRLSFWRCKRRHASCWVRSNYDPYIIPFRRCKRHTTRIWIWTICIRTT
jgi:hypothetical protein